MPKGRDWHLLGRMQVQRILQNEHHTVFAPSDFGGLWEISMVNSWMGFLHINYQLVSRIPEPSTVVLPFAHPSLRVLIPPWFQSQGGLAAMAGTTVWCRLSAVNGVWHAKEAPEKSYTPEVEQRVYP